MGDGDHNGFRPGLRGYDRAQRQAGRGRVAPLPRRRAGVFSFRGATRAGVASTAGHGPTRLRRYKKQAPRYWRSIVGPLAGGGDIPEARINIWLLVLEARKIPHFFQPGGKRPMLFVPALYETIALHEIQAVEAERPVPRFVQPVRDNLAGVGFVLLLLFFWHGIRWGWYSFGVPSPPFPESAGAWSAAFGVDPWRMRHLHEWWRAVTALTLHADDTHLLSNLAFGLVFLVLLCRRVGLGLGLALTFAAGVLGNAGNALLKDAHILSIGFSTALFGAVGGLCALNIADIARHQRRFAHMNVNKNSGLAFAVARHVAMPLAAGLALLGLLGGGGEARTDYAAHIWGFACGVGAGIALLPLEQRVFALSRKKQGTAQALLFAGTLLCVCMAWAWALL